jgi:hypothetical protein
MLGMNKSKGEGENIEGDIMIEQQDRTKFCFRLWNFDVKPNKIRI